MNTSTPDIGELLKTKEDLDPELKRYVFETEVLGPVLQHPLIYEVPYLEAMNALINMRFKLKKQAVQQALAESNYSQYLTLHERPYRWEALNRIAPKLKPDVLAQQFAWVWTDSENIWQNHHIIERLIARLRGHYRSIMDEGDLKRYDELPNEFEAFRGCQQRNRNGISYTLNEGVARSFAVRLIQPRDEALIVTARIKKEQVLFFTSARSEDEIVIKPGTPVTTVNQRVLALGAKP